MSTQATASTLVGAPPDKVYNILADYRAGHPQILPKEYFPSLEVEQGGVGAGTRIRFQMSVMGTKRTIHSVITEPEPGRVLVETGQALDTGTGTSQATTTFTVEPVAGGQQARVTISTELESGGGLFGWLEGVITKMFLRRIYGRELELLAAFAAEHSLDPSAT